MRPRDVTQPGRWVRASVAVAAAFLFLASTFANLHHFLPLTHAVCNEHGGLVHVQPGGFDAARSAPAGGPAVVHGGRAPGTVTSHEHCASAVAAHARSLPQPHAGVTPVPTPEPLAWRETQQIRRPATTPCYRVAPKQSPPA